MRGQGDEVVEAGHAERRRPARAGCAAGRPWPARRRARGGWAGGRAGSGRPACRAGSWAPRRGRGGGPARRCRRWVGQPRPPGALERGVEEADVEAHVVADDHGVADELEQASGSTVSMRGAGITIASVMPVSTVISGGIGRAGVDERLERAEALAAADLDRADLGDAARLRRAAGGLEVDDAERDVEERGAQIVEAALPAPYRPGVPNRRSCSQGTGRVRGPVASTIAGWPPTRTAARAAATSPASTWSPRGAPAPSTTTRVGGELAIEDVEVLDEYDRGRVVPLVRHRHRRGRDRTRRRAPRAEPLGGDTRMAERGGATGAGVAGAARE